MDEKKQKLFLSIVMFFLLFSLAPQVYRIWQTLQQPFDRFFSQPTIWTQMGMLLLTPSLILTIMLSLPLFERGERDAYQRPLLFNFVAAGGLQLVAVWQAYRSSAPGAFFYLLLAIFCFTAPFLINRLRARFEANRAQSDETK
ncbi:MAG: hypothetical protein ACOYYS_02565 [Chloroflexota bacterium]